MKCNCKLYFISSYLSNRVTLQQLLGGIRLSLSWFLNAIVGGFIILSRKRLKRLELARPKVIADL